MKLSPLKKTGMNVQWKYTFNLTTSNSEEVFPSSLQKYLYLGWSWSCFILLLHLHSPNRPLIYTVMSLYLNNTLVIQLSYLVTSTNHRYVLISSLLLPIRFHSLRLFIYLDLLSQAIPTNQSLCNVSLWGILLKNIQQSQGKIYQHNRLLGFNWVENFAIGQKSLMSVHVATVILKF